MVFGGPQAPSVVDANIALRLRQAPVHPSKVIVFYIWNFIYDTIWLCIKFIGFVWYRNYIRIFLLNYPYLPLLQ
jgi:hypothetical protein